MATSAPRCTSSPCSPGSQRDPSGRTTRISALGIALPIESEPPVDLGRIEVGRAKRLREPVHEVTAWRCGKIARSFCERRPGHAPAGVGEVAQAAARLGRPGLLGELDPQRRHAGEPGDPVPRTQPDDVAGQQVVDEHHVRAHTERGRELAEAGVEAERQGGEDAVVLGVLQVLAHALGAGDEVAMGEHHALRLARCCPTCRGSPPCRRRSRRTRPAGRGARRTRRPRPEPRTRAW